MVTMIPLPLPSRRPAGLSGFGRRVPGLRRRALLWALVDLLLRWQARAEERHALGALDERLLRDIGVSRGRALEEARKPFWQP